MGGLHYWTHHCLCTSEKEKNRQTWALSQFQRWRHETFQNQANVVHPASCSLLIRVTTLAWALLPHLGLSITFWLALFTLDPSGPSLLHCQSDHFYQPYQIVLSCKVFCDFLMLSMWRSTPAPGVWGARALDRSDSYHLPSGSLSSNPPDPLLTPRSHPPISLHRSPSPVSTSPLLLANPCLSALSLLSVLPVHSPLRTLVS